MKKNLFLLAASALLILFLQSCQKDSSDPLPVIPDDTAVTFLPSSIEYISVDVPEDNSIVKFLYSQAERTIKVNISYPTNTSPYRYPVSYNFYFTGTGYLQKREIFFNDGSLSESFVAERDNSNILKRVLVERDGYTPKDTFNFTFSDSANGYKIMEVKTRYRNIAGSDFPTSDQYTFLNNKLVKEKGGLFSDNISTHISPSFSQSFDAADRLISMASFDNSYQISYSYETLGNGLDSFYYALAGKDGHYLSTCDTWPSYSDQEFYFFPLRLYLNSSAGEINTEMHRYGAMKEVKAMPDNVVFSFQNTFDTSQRITETKIMNNGSLYGTYKITY